MTSNEAVVQVIEALERLNVSYMLVGSYSSNAFGIPRSTQDADFVVQTDDSSLSHLFQALSPIVRFDPQMQFESVTMTMRYIGRIPELPFKIELFLLSDDSHDRERFERRRRATFLDGTAFLPSPEDVVIQKLRWFHRSRRVKDLDDVKNVLAVQVPENLDLGYIRRWCDEHGTRALFEQVLKEVPPV
jgi:hypothetical protein